MAFHLKLFVLRTVGLRNDDFRKLSRDTVNDDIRFCRVQSSKYF